jgi:hypothetical protein
MSILLIIDDLNPKFDAYKFALDNSVASANFTEPPGRNKFNLNSTDRNETPPSLGPQPMETTDNARPFFMPMRIIGMQ